jgi:hypothetical protein
MDYLERQADIILKWATKCEKQVLSEADLKRQLRKSTQHSEDDILLLLAHLKHSGKMATETISKAEENDAELIICKLANIDNKKPVSISLKEKAKFALVAN